MYLLPLKKIQEYAVDERRTKVRRFALQFIFVAVWPWPATQGHTVALSPLPPLGWGGEWKEKGKNSWVMIKAVYQNSK